MTAVLITIGIGVAVGFIATEFTGWTRTGAWRIVRRAARNLPPAARARYLEEWRGELDQKSDRPLSMLACAVRIAARARGLAKEIPEPAAHMVATREALHRFVEFVERESASLTIAAVIIAPTPFVVDALKLGGSPTQRGIALALAMLLSVLISIAIRRRRGRAAAGSRRV